MGTRNFNLIGRKIIGIGRNYLEHAKEMSSPLPKEPMFFLKPTSSYVLEPNTIKIPQNLKVDHESKSWSQFISRSNKFYSRAGSCYRKSW